MNTETTETNNGVTTTMLSPKIKTNKSPKTGSPSKENLEKKKFLMDSLDDLIGIDGDLEDDDDDDDRKDDFSDNDSTPNSKSSHNNSSRNFTVPEFDSYKLIEHRFGGSVEHRTINCELIKGQSIEEGIQLLKENPDKYIGLHYAAMILEDDWEVIGHQYTLIEREGTEGLKITYDPDGQWVVLINIPETCEDDKDQFYQGDPVFQKRKKSQRTSDLSFFGEEGDPLELLVHHGEFDSEEEKLQHQSEARERCEAARNRRLELDEKRKEQFMGRYEQQLQYEDNPVKRIPKRSALLAMGGPDEEEYKKMVKQERLALWESQIGDDEWQIPEFTFDGVSLSETMVEETVRFESVQDAIENFQKDPDKYIAMYFSADRIYNQQSREKSVEVTHVLRTGTTSYKPLGVRTGKGGCLALYRHVYKRLEPMKNDLVPKKYCDEHTSEMTFRGKKLQNKKKQKRKPLLPGRGMGLGDCPTMTFIGDCAEPNDVFQGTSVGDCWLLSAIASLADFDFAIRRLFRKTELPKLEERPTNFPNHYVVTLWDLETWTEVDIHIDERLPVRSDNSGYLLGAKPSQEGKIWVPYLEKAIAIHCGGYDKLQGGNCSNAWSMLTGSRNQYILRKNSLNDKYQCFAKYNENEKMWAPHKNSPRDDRHGIWRVDWPKVGGGGSSEEEMDEDELFHRIAAWDKNNFLIGASTGGISDKDSTGGLVDNHAYSIIDSRANVCDTGIDLLLIRNPWGEGGELKSAEFARNGPGWERYPSVLLELNPSMDDNGMCWITKEEFFEHFTTIYLSAFNTARLKEADYVNDLEDDFPRPTTDESIEEEDDYSSRENTKDSIAEEDDFSHAEEEEEEDLPKDASDDIIPEEGDEKDESPTVDMNVDDEIEESPLVEKEDTAETVETSHNAIPKEEEVAEEVETIHDTIPQEEEDMDISGQNKKKKEILPIEADKVEKMKQNLEEQMKKKFTSSRPENTSRSRIEMLKQKFQNNA